MLTLNIFFKFLLAFIKGVLFLSVFFLSVIKGWMNYWLFHRKSFLFRNTDGCLELETIFIRKTALTGIYTLVGVVMQEHWTWNECIHTTASKAATNSYCYIDFSLIITIWYIIKCLKIMENSPWWHVQIHCFVQTVQNLKIFSLQWYKAEKHNKLKN